MSWHLVNKSRDKSRTAKPYKLARPSTCGCGKIAIYKFGGAPACFECIAIEQTYEAKKLKVGKRVWGVQYGAPCVDGYRCELVAEDGKVNRKISSAT